MESKRFTDLINLVRLYNPGEVDKVTKAYEFAKQVHAGQYRQSGEEYIVHPVNVAYILAQIHADGDTLCAGLLHDVIEDGDITREQIAETFNKDVACLVDGVTKLAKMNYASKQKLNCANTRKIITGIMDDVRIIFVKLADRLHNMRTLQFKSPEKQKENALETLDIFVPLAYYIGAYRIKSELEDLSFRYIDSSAFFKTQEKQLNVQTESEAMIREMLAKISYLLSQKEIPYEIKARIKNVFGIYKMLEQGKDMREIHDLLTLKIMVDDIDNCYRTLGIIHSAYKPLDYSIRDFICNPKSNMHQSLSSTLIGPGGRLVHSQIRTFDMDKVASFGLSALWDKSGSEARDEMQQQLKTKLQFSRSLKQIDAAFADDEEFVLQVRSELFGDKIYVHTVEGDYIELPVGATVVDFAYQIHSDVGNHLYAANVNDTSVPLNCILKNKDVVQLFTDENASPSADWEDFVVTTRARKKMRDFKKHN